MKKSNSERYNQKFYSEQVDGSARSAKVVLGLLYDFYTPRRVMEIGCGRGAWLTEAERLGADTLKGFDGAWVKREELLSPRIDFSSVDLEHDVVEGDGKFDLCICLEVAEHISEPRSGRLIDSLTQASDVVLFGAAIRHQGGVRHINEQNQSYWIALFEERGYRCLDIVRPAVWNNDEVEWWYRQNSFLFVKQDADLFDMEGLEKKQRPIPDVVHPEKLAIEVRKIQDPTLKFCWKCFKRFLSNAFKG